MLGDAGISNAEKLGQLADGALPLHQLTENEEAMAASHCLQEIAGPICRSLHAFYLNIHYCEYTQ
jgi:hypothetical protein